MEMPAVETATDRIHRLLYDRIVVLDLSPGQKISEVEIARELDVSRQPVRDAFYRLSQQGFLSIRPQRATTVSPISAEAVMQASFVRTAIEIAVLEELAAAPEVLERAGPALEALLEEQRISVTSGDRVRFHELDDRLHRSLFALAGRSFAWGLVSETKAHMDRVRYISLEHGQRQAFDDHVALISDLQRGRTAAACARMRAHLSRIADVLERAHRERPELF